MKLHSLLAVAMGTLLAAGCSSDAPFVNNGDNGNNGATGNAYISLSVQLPTSTSTRATDTFDDGTADEYAVKDMTVLIFDANDKFETYYTTENGSMELPSGWNSNNSTNITTTATTQALKVNDGEKHVVVVLNNQKMFDFSKITQLSDLKSFTNASVFKANGDAATPKSIGDFSGAAGKFFMTSSPYYNGNASTPKIIDYATVTPTNQINNPGRAKVYVERLAAKVSLSEDLTNKDYTVQTGVAKDSKARFTGWTLDVQNQSSYLFRHVKDEWVATQDARTKFTDNTPENNRIRFAEDTNYGDDQQETSSSATPKPVKTGLFFYRGEEGEVSNAVNTGTSVYCFENTFDINNMRQDRTTRVIFKAKYTPAGTDFDASHNANGNWYTIGASATPLNEEQFVARVNKAIADAGLSTTSTPPVTKEMVQTNLKATDREITAAALGYTGSDADTKTQKVRTALGSIQVYKGGICYYIGRIRHFDDSEANWTIGTNGYDAASLGRYGIVRNNWYKLTVSKVSQPGSPFIPQTTTDLDDVNNYYIDCDVNIEPWAVRSQGFDF